MQHAQILELRWAIRSHSFTTITSEPREQGHLQRSISRKVNDLDAWLSAYLTEIHLERLRISLWGLLCFISLCSTSLDKIMKAVVIKILHIDTRRLVWMSRVRAGHLRMHTCIMYMPLGGRTVWCSAFSLEWVWSPKYDHRHVECIFPYFEIRS